MKMVGIPVGDMWALKVRLASAEQGSNHVSQQIIADLTPPWWENAPSPSIEHGFLAFALLFASILLLSQLFPHIPRLTSLFPCKITRIRLHIVKLDPFPPNRPFSCCCAIAQLTMRTFSGTTLADPSASSNRRQPVRQTRTNPSRSATNIVQPRTSLGAALNDDDEPAPGFCPAITHFTDSITALPKEMIRHYTMLKEVDAKIYGPEESIGQLVAAALNAPVPPRQPAPVQHPIDLTCTNTDLTDIAAGSVSESTAPSQAIAPSVSGSLDDPNTTDGPRRRLFAHLRSVMGEMLSTLDEKNHVMLTAMEGLDKQLARCDSSFPYIANEVSEEARLGSKTHWAIRDKTAEKKASTTTERTRHATTHLASNAAIQDAEGAAARSEVRREALAARKQRNNYVDSDFDDKAAQTAKKPILGAKGRKAVDTLPTNGTGLGITGVASAAPQSKRRKIEKGPTSGLPTERAMGTVYGLNAGAAKANGNSPRDTSVLDQAKKRGRAAVLPSGTGRRRYV